jgi:hypothetical protein
MYGDQIMKSTVGKKRRDPHPAPHHLVTQNSVEAFPKL